MYLAFWARVLAAGALGVAVAATAVAGPAPTPSAQASVVITPGMWRLKQESRQGPSTTAECEQAMQIACYNPGQMEQAYSLPALYSRGITGKGTTIAIVDPGS
jgi:subtilase family serine protease